MDLFKNHAHITDNMRSIVYDWFIEICAKFKIYHRELYRALVIFDKFVISKKNLPRCELQAAGITSLWIVTKLCSVKPLTVKQCVTLCASTYTKTEIMEMERKILEKLNYNIYFKNFYDDILNLCMVKNISAGMYDYINYVTIMVTSSVEYFAYDTSILMVKIIEFVDLIDKFEITNQSVVKQTLCNDYYFCFILKSLNNSKPELTNIKYYHKRLYGVSQISIFRDKICNIFGTTTYEDVINSIQKITSDPKKIDIFNTTPLYIIGDTGNPLIFEKLFLKTRKQITEIGSGTFGSVYHIVSDNNDYAMKKVVIDKDDYYYKEGISGYILRELNALNILRHKNIVNMIGFMHDFSEQTTRIFLELMDCTLHVYIKKHTLDAKKKKALITDLMSGLEFMHRNKIMHRDLSSANILISKDGILKISDLGSAINFNVEISTDCYCFSETVCTIYFRSPELLNVTSKYNHKIDIWSCGCLIGFILKNDYIFCSLDTKGMLNSINELIGESDEKVGKGFADLETCFPLETKLMYQMLKIDPEKRIEICYAINLYEQMQKDPKADQETETESKAVQETESKADQETESKTDQETDLEPNADKETDTNQNQTDKDSIIESY